MKTLREIGSCLATDKVTKHGYDIPYDRHFGQLRAFPLRILEIGVACGGSLRMWEEYFPDAQLIGVDIDPSCLEHAGARARVFIGDQADRCFLERVVRESPGPFDIVIDDGGHPRRPATRGADVVRE